MVGISKILGYATNYGIQFFSSLTPETRHLKPDILLDSLRRVDSLDEFNDHESNVILGFAARSEDI
jgi:hypothetical protein